MSVDASLRPPATDAATDAATAVDDPHPHAWRRVAAAMFVIGWGGNQFTPLLSVYKELGGFTQLDVDVFLGAYVFGLIPGLLVASALSNRLGRRPVLLAGLWSALVGTLLLSLGVHGGYAGVVGGRMLSGVSVGIAMSVGTTWVSELATRSGTRSGAGARRSALWLTAGLGLGPASAGLLAQYASPALTWPFLTHALLCVPAIVLLTTAPWAETRARRTEPLRLADLRVPAVRHRRFLRVVLPMAPWVFGSAAVAYAIVPQQVEGAVGEWALLFAAALAVGTLGTGVLVQPVARRLDDAGSARAIVVSMALMTVGVALAAVTAATESPWLAAPVALLLGAAYGIAVVSGLLEVQRIARPDELAGLTGVYYALCYVGFLLPAVLAGLAHWFGYPAMLTAVAVLAAGCAAVCAAHWAKHLPAAA
ncbi:MFS transporter [Sporichthya brevicatena]|uniref:MFS transporter n=1 Tax=Sporichthya brevicatena TaxID=171442 RepID=A0ABN1HDA6_9ACTN